MSANEHKPVDVLAVMVELMTHGGTIEPRRIIPEWNKPRPTGLIANRARAATGKTLSALRRAARDGDVILVGAGNEVAPSWRQSAAQARELYWRVSDAALARCGVQS